MINNDKYRTSYYFAFDTIKLKFQIFIQINFIKIYKIIFRNNNG